MNTGAQTVSTGDPRVDALIELAGRIGTMEARLDAAGLFAMRRSAELRELNQRMDGMESRLSLDVVGTGMPGRTRRVLVGGVSAICAAAVAVITINCLEMGQNADIARQDAVTNSQVLRMQRMYTTGHETLSQEVQRIAQVTGAAPKATGASPKPSAKPSPKTVAKHRRKAVPAPQMDLATAAYEGRHRGTDTLVSDFKRSVEREMGGFQWMSRHHHWHRRDSWSDLTL